MSSRPPLACPVRGCEQPLGRSERSLACANGHSFDISRSGYVNLLQPQDRRSPRAGDTKAAVEARARLLADGVGRTILDAVVARAAAVALPDAAVALDLGCGSGELLAEMATRHRIVGVGIDLSTAAAERAARRFPSLTWVVANADRRLPVLDHTVHVVLSLHARRNPAECARVLAPQGWLVIALPAPDDVIELRAEVQGAGQARDRVAPVIAEHERWFTLVERSTVRERHRLERTALLDLLRGTYRGERESSGPRIEALTELDVTLSSEILLLRPNDGAQE